MRIQGPKIPGIQPNVNKTEESDRSAKSSETPRGEQAVVVSIGTASRSTLGGSSASEAIKARLDEVRSQLNSGQYPVDFDRLAESILADEVGRDGA